MDKYEYNLKMEQIKKLIGRRDYMTAAQICDSIEWKRVKNNNTLTMVADVYEAVKQYEKAKDVLLIAYERSPLGRQLAYRLTLLSVREKDFLEADEFYQDFVEVAPQDVGQYILKYEIAKAKGEDIDVLIQILRSYAEVDIDEKWQYELAYLYHKAGYIEECIDQCNELYLWFNDGKYVEMALKLKQKYAPLTKSQQEALQQMESGFLPGMPVTEEAAAEEELPEEKEVKTQKVLVKKKPVPDFEKEEKEPEKKTIPVSKKVMPEAEEVVIEEKNIPKEVPEVKVGLYDTTNLQETIANSMAQLLKEMENNRNKKSGTEETKAQEKSETEEPEEMAAEEEIEEIEKTKKIEIRKEETAPMESVEIEGEAETEAAIATEEPEEKDSKEIEEPEEASSEETDSEEVKDMKSEEEPEAEEKDSKEIEEPEEASSEETDSGEEKDMKSEEEPEAEEKDSKEIEEPEEASSEEPDSGEEKDMKSEEEPEAEEKDSKEIEEPEEVSLEESDSMESDEAVNLTEKPILQEEEADDWRKDLAELEEEPDDLMKALEAIEREITASEKALEKSRREKAKAQEETRMEEEPEKEEPKKPEVRVPKEPEKEIPQEKKKYFTQFLEMRGLESQIADTLENLKDKYSADGTSAKNNVCIMGESKTGRSTLALAIMKVANRDRQRRGRKVAKVKGVTLNKRSMRNSMGKLLGADLLIEQAGSLTPNMVREIEEVMQGYTGGMLVILEDDQAALERLFDIHPEFAKMFSNHIEIKEYDINEWVKIAKNYANDQGYGIDEMGTLALYAKISEIVGVNQEITKEDIANIIDSAIEKSERKNLGKLFDIVFSRKYKESDLSMLREADFQ